jgi:hypothetical protein
MRFSIVFVDHALHGGIVIDPGLVDIISHRIANLTG